MLQTGAGALGLSLPGWLQLQQQARADKLAVTGGKAKQCIVIYCWGGISHYESWDPKPNAPAELRGEFATIQPATPGIHYSEHIPLMAQHSD